MERCPSWPKEHDWKSCKPLKRFLGFESPSLRHFYYNVKKGETREHMCEKKTLKSKIWLTVVTCAAILFSVVFAFGWDHGEKETPNKNNTMVVAQNGSGQPREIPVAMAADDNYTYPTIVAITSMMINSNSNTRYDIYIMTPGGFGEDNKQKILSLQGKYENRCKIMFIDMQDRYKNANDRGHITTPTYYRLSLSSALPEIEKIIWLDGDVLVLGDLAEMYDIGMEDLYYRGFLDANVRGTEKFGIYNDHFICAGVMLANLAKLRADNMEQKFEEFIKRNNDRLEQHDQTVINVVCYKNTDFLPAKYGIFNFGDVGVARDHAKIFLAKGHYTEDEMQAAYENPVILHCICKPWGQGEVNRKSLWWAYAAKTDYFKEIEAKYNFSAAS